MSSAWPVPTATTLTQIQGAESAAAIAEGNAADHLQALGAKETHDFAGILIEFLAARDEGAAFSDGAARWRSFARDGHFGFEQALAAGKIERVNFEQAADWVEEREASVVVMNDALQSGNDATEQFGQLKAGDQDIVDIQQDAETVAFVGELGLISLRGFEVQRVVDGHGHLAGDALHELQFAFGDALRH